jgi:hypothetical protein
MSGFVLLPLVLVKAFQTLMKKLPILPKIVPS